MAIITSIFFVANISISAQVQPGTGSGGAVVPVHPSACNPPPAKLSVEVKRNGDKDEVKDIDGLPHFVFDLINDFPMTQIDPPTLQIAPQAAPGSTTSAQTGTGTGSGDSIPKYTKPGDKATPKDPKLTLWEGMRGMADSLEATGDPAMIRLARAFRIQAENIFQAPVSGVSSATGSVSPGSIGSVPSGGTGTLALSPVPSGHTGLPTPSRVPSGGTALTPVPSGGTGTPTLSDTGALTPVPSGRTGPLVTGFTIDGEFKIPSLSVSTFPGGLAAVTYEPPLLSALFRGSTSPKLFANIGGIWTDLDATKTPEMKSLNKDKNFHFDNTDLRITIGSPTRSYVGEDTIVGSSLLLMIPRLHVDADDQLVSKFLVPSTVSEIQAARGSDPSEKPPNIRDFSNLRDFYEARQSYDFMVFHKEMRALRKSKEASTDSEVKTPLGSGLSPQQQLQQLVDLETLFDAQLKALNAASMAYGVHHATLAGQTGITLANLANVRGAIILHRMLHDIGSALLDFASVIDFIKNIKELGDKAFLDKFFAQMEVMKDAEGFLTTLLQNLTGLQGDIQFAGQVAPAMIDTLVSYGIMQPGDTTQKLRDNLNEIISQVTDAINNLRELVKLYNQHKGDVTKLKQALGKFSVSPNIGQMAGTAVKAISKRILQERMDRANQTALALVAESAIALEIFEDFIRINDKVVETRKKLEEVRTQKDKISNETKAPFTRGSDPTVIETYDGKNYPSWGKTLQVTDKLITATIGGQAARPETVLPAALRRTATCEECQPIADEINRLNARKLSLTQEQDDILKATDHATDLKNQRNRLLEDATARHRQNQTGEGLSGNPFEARTDTATNKGGIDASTAEARGLRTEIDRLEARRNELGPIDQEIGDINGQVDKLNTQLFRCEAEKCQGTALGIGSSGAVVPGASDQIYWWGEIEREKAIKRFRDSGKVVWFDTRAISPFSDQGVTNVSNADCLAIFPDAAKPSFNEPNVGRNVAPAPSLDPAYWPAAEPESLRISLSEDE